MMKLTLLATLFLAAICSAEPVRIIVDTDHPGHAVPATLHGIFFEEINHAGEGGLYAELVLNRDFEMTTLPDGARWAGNLLRTKDDWQERKWFGNQLWGWQFIADGGARGSIRLDEREPLNGRNPHSICDWEPANPHHGINHERNEHETRSHLFRRPAVDGRSRRRGNSRPSRRQSRG